MSDKLIIQKDVDKSVLYEGMSIPSVFQDIFYDQLGFRIAKGENLTIKIIIDGDEYSATLKNNPFDEKKYPGHPEVLQIRYGKNSEIAIKLREKFPYTLKKVNDYLEHKTDTNKQLIIPETEREYIAIYSTSVRGTLMMDCISNDEYRSEISEIQSQDEESYEEILNQEDTSATLITTITTRKVRKLSRAIGENLKIVYGYRCQICGQFIGERYGSQLIHAHHIDYFTESLNNNADNIMIVCPNHHGIIHDCNPVFDRKAKVYKYPNGYKEGLLLNKHL